MIFSNDAVPFTSRPLPICTRAALMPPEVSVSCGGRTEGPQYGHQRSEHGGRRQGAAPARQQLAAASHCGVLYPARLCSHTAQSAELAGNVPHQLGAPCIDLGDAQGAFVADGRSCLAVHLDQHG